MKRFPKNASYAVMGFLYPFGGLLYSIWNFRKPYAKLLFYIFCLFVGYNFMYFRDSDELGTTDASRYATNFKAAYQYQISWDESIFQNGEAVDLFAGTISYVLSRFTDNPKYFFFVLAIIMGFFLTENLWFILYKLKGKVYFPTIILLLLFSFISPIWKIDGVRWGTALQVFVYGAFHILFEKKYTYLIWCFLTLLIHFSFFVPLIILNSFLLLPKKNLNFFFIFFIISTFIKQIDVTEVGRILEVIMPEYMLPRIGYVDVDYVEKRQNAQQSAAFFLKYLPDIYRWVIIILSFVSFILIKQRKLLLSDSLRIFFNFSLYFAGIAQIIAIIPIGGRYLLISYTFIFAFFILVSNMQGVIMLKKTIIWILPLIIYILVVDVRLGLNYLNYISIFGNFIIATFVELNTPLSANILDLFK